MNLCSSHQSQKIVAFSHRASSKHPTLCGLASQRPRPRGMLLQQQVINYKLWLKPAINFDNLGVLIHMNQAAISTVTRKLSAPSRATQICLNCRRTKSLNLPQQPQDLFQLMSLMHMDLMKINCPKTFLCPRSIAIWSRSIRPRYYPPLLSSSSYSLIF